MTRRAARRARSIGWHIVRLASGSLISSEDRRRAWRAKEYGALRPEKGRARHSGAKFFASTIEEGANMSNRTMILAIALSVGAIASTSAQSNRPGKDDPLKRLLQERFNPQSSQQSVPSSGANPNTRKFEWIAPKGGAQPRVTPADGSGSLSPNHRFAYRTAENTIGRTSTDARGLASGL